MRGPKKSETIEIRLPYEAKQAFMARCRAQGVSASEALRGFIDGRTSPRDGLGRWRWIAAAVAITAIGAAAAPSLARPSLQTEFARIDADRDGALSLAEFEAAAVVVVSPGRTVAASPGREALLREEFANLDADRNGRLSLDELRRAR